MFDKRADLAGPGIADYAELEKILPQDYQSLLCPKETQRAIFATKTFIEERLCQELNLMMVTVPLIVDAESGVNDYLDRDGSRAPIQFHISNDRDRHPVDAQIVQAATKWRRMALKRFDMAPGEGLCTDMRAVRKDYFLDHDHSVYVDQWDWEAAIRRGDRKLDFLKQTVNCIWKVIVDAEEFVQDRFPQLKTAKYPNLPKKLTFLHAEDILDMYPDLPRKQRKTAILQECPWIGTGLVFVVLAEAAWRWEMVGGLLLAAVGFSAGVAYAISAPPQLPVATRMLTAIVFSGPPVAAGILLAAASGRSRPRGCFPGHRTG
jgi:aspartate--ammonia ligase